MGAPSKVITRLAAALVVITVLAACVQPVAPTPTPTLSTIAIPPTAVATPTAPPQVGPTFPSSAIGTYLAGGGTVVNNLSLFTQLQAGPDDIVGYTFQDANGQTCVGFVLTTAATAQIWNGDYRCLTAGSTAIVAPLLFALTNGEPYVATYGYVDAALLPTANAFAIVFQDGTSDVGMLTNFGFLRLRQGVNFPTQAVIIDAGGNTLASVPLQ